MKEVQKEKVVRRWSGASGTVALLQIVRNEEGCRVDKRECISTETQQNKHRRDDSSLSRGVSAFQFSLRASNFESKLFGFFVFE
jgi:hypothetical protein